MGVKISDLPQATTSQNDDIFPIVQNGVTKQVSKELIVEEVNNKCIISPTEPEVDYGVWFAKGKNLFDRNNINLRTGYILNDNGTEITDNTGGYTRNYSSVEPNTQYVLTGMQKGNGNRRIYYYNSNKTFISRTPQLSGSDTSYTFTTPANCNYINIQIHTQIDTDFSKWDLELAPYITPSINVDGYEIYNSNISNYSTDEIKIGTWIDGKPIYRKVFSATSPSTESTSASQILTFNFSIDTLIKLEGNIYYNNTTWRDINGYQTNSLFSFVDVVATNKEIRQCVTGSGYLSKPEYIILEYTKTTD